MSLITLEINTNGENFYEITNQAKNALSQQHGNIKSGIMYLFIPHTSCALTITEAYDPTAVHDIKCFLKHIAPESLNFIQHTAEGKDDSPSHMKSILLNHSLHIPFEDGKLLLGRWQGIFLTEFRTYKHIRKVYLKCIFD
ncbi:MAG: YjbQ family protein [Bdellovibrionales bacterium]|nr:YjbQ family protein [Bdellovibrionales bacterium]